MVKVLTQQMDDDVAKTKPAPEPSPHHKLDKEKLERLKETIRKELSKIRLENEAKRQVQKEETKSDDSKKRKHPIERIVWVPKTDGASTTPLQSFQGESETSRRVILKPTQQPRVEKKRETKVLRKCQLCMRSTANMKNHLAFSHLKESWWGVLPDQTCWRCKEYHPLWKIRCYLQQLHSQKTCSADRHQVRLTSRVQDTQPPWPA